MQAPVQPVPDRFVPLPSPGSAREGGGTGVFLPRVFKDEDKKKPCKLQTLTYLVVFWTHIMYTCMHVFRLSQQMFS